MMLPKPLKPGSEEAMEAWKEAIEKSRGLNIWVLPEELLSNDKNRVMSFFWWASAPEGREYWANVNFHGHTEESLRTLKCIAMFLKITRDRNDT